mmetsp:Transcript_65180/g.142860  ORF Transcript_65180/g.142860 Transcript_65180/m.142860 type:complete len:259 (-) Transcript_65180:802-1578(-)
MSCDTAASNRNARILVIMSPSPFKRSATPCTTTIATIRLTNRASKRTPCLRPNNKLWPISEPALSLESLNPTLFPDRIKSAMPFTNPSGSRTSSALPPTLSLSLIKRLATSSSDLVRKAFTIIDRSSPASPLKSMTRPQSNRTSCTGEPSGGWRHKMFPGCKSPWTNLCLKTIAQKLSTKIRQASSLSTSMPLGSSSKVFRGSPSSKLMTRTSRETHWSNTSGMTMLLSLLQNCCFNLRRFCASVLRSVWAFKKAENC